MNGFDEWVVTPDIYEKLEQFNAKWPSAMFGPAHIVLDDYNLFDGHIHFCLRELTNYEPGNYSCEHSAEELTATRELLEWLLTVPEDSRCEYEGGGQA